MTRNYFNNKSIKQEKKGQEEKRGPREGERKDLLKNGNRLGLIVPEIY
jgi:hypothetical protein